MKILLIVAILTSMAFSKVEVAVSYKYIEDITKNIAGDLVEIETLAKPKEDPHFVMARPSLISKLRNVDLLILNGGQLEIGWLPPLIKRANNAKIFDGAGGFLDLSQHINMLDVHSSVSRADGDVHPDGNPHFILDPYNVPIIAKAIADKLSKIDSSNKETYQKNYEAFTAKWDKNLIAWGEKMKPFKGKKVIQYHKSFDYFLKRYKMELLDTIEPLPGISPTSKHIMELISKIKEEKAALLIMHDVYHNRKAAKLISAKTELKIIDVPHDVDALQGADSIENFYNSIINGLTK
ncbi:zinc ABC transporter substrate-binding protein [bacterium]|nr:zinc ABC transporter substrate-binding protein [bacterium]MBU1958983.1 zinc ABC transporter substrate-binding protein [bacterium]